LCYIVGLFEIYVLGKVFVFKRLLRIQLFFPSLEFLVNSLSLNQFFVRLVKR